MINPLKGENRLMKNNRLRSVILLLACLGASLGLQADNIIHIGNASGSPGEEATVSVALTNSDAVSAMQLRVTMPEGISLVDGSAELASRATDHSATVGVKDGVLNIMVYSMNMTALSGNEGDVVSFRVRLGNQPGQFALNAQEVILTGADGNVLGSSATNGSVTIVAPKAQYNSMTVDFGHVPIRDTYTKTVTVSNVGNAPLTVEGLVFSDDAFSSTTTFPLTIDAGGNATVNITYAPTERGAIEETMKVVCNSISKLNTIKLTADPFAVNELHVQNASGISDETVTLNLTMNNMDDITGFQWEFNLPSLLEYVDGSFQLSDRKADHTFVTTLKDGVLRVVCYSITDTPFAGNDGDIASFDVIIRGRNNATVSPSKAVLSSMVKGKVTDVLSATYSGTVTVRSPRLNAPSSLAMGETPVTTNAEKTFTVRNQGSAPLTISRVVFNDDHLSLKESATLPIVIESNKTVTLTVVYDGTEEIAYDAIMQLYSNDPEQRVFNVKVTGSRFAPNYVAFTTEDINYGEDLSVDMTINTYDEVEGFQFDVTYPAQFQLADEAVVLGEAAQGMSVTHRAIDATTERFFCYFLSGTGVPAGENELMSIIFNPKETAVGGTYQVKISNIKLGTSDLNDKYAGKEINSSFSVLCAAISVAETLDMGGVPVTEETVSAQLNIENTGLVALIINKVEIDNEDFTIVEAMPVTINPSQSTALTINYTGTALGTVTTVMHISSNDPSTPVKEVTITVNRFTPNYMEATVADIYAGETAHVQLAVDTYDTIDEIQFDVAYPDGFVLGENCYEVNEALPGMTVTHNSAGNNTEHFVCRFAEGNSLAPGKNNLLSILLSTTESVTLGMHQIDISNVVMKTADRDNCYAGENLSAVFRVKSQAEQDYFFCEYIYNTAPAVLDLGVTEKSCLIFKAKIEYNRANGSVFLGTRGSSERKDFRFFLASSTTYFDIQNSRLSKYNLIRLNTIYEIEFGNNYLKVDGNTALSRNAVADFEYSDYHMTAFNDEIGKIYWLQIYDGETLVKDLVPAIRKSDGAVGMYDQLSGEFLTASSGILYAQKFDKVTITANSYTIQYGDAMPEFGFTSEGMDVTGVPEITCEATTTSPVGTYPIVIGRGSVTNNNDTYVNGVLTIEKAPLTITAKDYTRYVGDENPVFEAEYTGFKNDETNEVLSVQPTFTCEANSESEEGEYPIVVSGAEAQNYEITYVNGKLTINSYLLGDVNGDGKINVLDIVKIVGYIMGSPTQPFIEKAAHHNDDGVINVLDLVKEVSLVMAQSSTSSAGAKAMRQHAATTLPSMTIINEEQNKICIGTDDNRAYIVAQLMVETTPGVKISDIASDDKHVVAYREVADNRYIVVCYSMTNAPFKSNDEMIKLTYTGSGCITVYDAIFVDEDANEVNFGSVSSDQTTDINGVFSDMKPADIYTLGGKLMRKSATTTKGLPKGVYIVNGQKITVR